ncbi:DUF389 domain-containing protein [Pseudanabaena sp. ABRG5-3]|uniref:DUF389 domain-containing protein n=1 Tax=Pseudanabaena sp. ABRG5-3 TaxID=685565 RepID=UPI0013A63880|nr:DUF389 domain-containing protein [Pseudanabaena sp. ABRG5-3]
MPKNNDNWHIYRDWLATQMGIDEERKTEVYLEISQAATLADAAYWFQLIFAAGIATIGLVLSSPAVIIGAMLISPLMGPILSLGLALAAGDFVLLVRAIANLTISCSVAISFAILLIFTLPFKEATSEILARTTPNTLDLAVALFSGAIGAIATCRPIKGVITSIPGVSIAVALMPPLCVVGFGIGMGFSLSLAEGLQISRGGGLLFLTNLVAIAFASTLVFLGLNIDTETVRTRVKLWESSDRESLAVQNFLGRYNFLQKLRPIGSLPSRLLVGFVSILALLVPLSSSFAKLGEEISLKQQQNTLRRNAISIWQDQFSNFPNKQIRSSIERLSISEKDKLITVKLHVFTSKIYSDAEKEQYVQELANKLDKDPQQIQFTLTEIPTASNEILAKKEEISQPTIPTPPSLNELQVNLLQALNKAIADVSLPPNTQLVDYAVSISNSQALLVNIVYLSDRALSEDAQILVIQDIQKRLRVGNAKVSLDHISTGVSEILFDENTATIPTSANDNLDQLGKLLQLYPQLNLSVAINLRNLENNDLKKSRFQAIATYLGSKWQISQQRLNIVPSINSVNLNAVNSSPDSKALLKITISPKKE